MRVSFDVNLFIHADPRVLSLLDQLLKGQQKMSNDFTGLQSTLDTLKATVANEIVPLLQKLATTPSDDQATIDALKAEAQGVVDTLKSNEPPAAPPSA